MGELGAGFGRGVPVELAPRGAVPSSLPEAGRAGTAPGPAIRSMREHANRGGAFPPSGSGFARYLVDASMLLPARILVVLLATAVPLLAGCADDEYGSREAAYPAAVGSDDHSPPAKATTDVAASETLPPAPPPYQPATVQAQPPPAQVVPPGEVTVDDTPGGAEAGYGPEDQYADTDPSALSDFRSTLQPYGEWTEDPTYGTVWVPSQSVVGSDFTPYATAGHWTYDDDEDGSDYTWVSDYDWGWAPFHYGRWVYSTPYGWGWIPGRTYAGAWVSWRYGYDDWGYVGWGPLAPTWCWRGGAAYGLGFVPRVPYGFVGRGDLFAGAGLRERMVGAPQVSVVASHSRPWVGASPSVNGGRVTASPHVNGPPPSVLGIPTSGIAHGGSNNRGVLQARAFAHASTATRLGGHPPQASAVARGGGLARSSGYAQAQSSHFGGRLGGGFSGSALNARPSYGYSLGSRPYYGASPSSRGAYGSGGGAGYRGFAGGSVPSYGGYARPGGAPNGGSSAGHPVNEGSSGGFHGGGSGGGGFHGGGGSHGGGGHGGGGHR
jgi:hypothetical protein